MKVLQLAKFFPPVEGGIESTVATLSSGLRERGVAVDVLCAALGRHGSHERLADGTQVWRAGRWTQWLSTSLSPALLAQLRRIAADYALIHVHMPDPMAALALWWIRPQARVVLHWHSDVVRQRLALRLYEPLQDWLLRRADAVIATSPPYAEASKALRRYRDKTVVIPLGIGEPQVDGAQLQAVRARVGGRPLVFALGRHTYYKGFDVLLRAAAQLPPEVLTVIGGDGPERAGLQRQLEELGLQDRVWLPGRLSDAELHAWYATADVFCLPSVARSEAFGVAMVEAMAAGKPVLATQLPGSGVPWVNREGETGLNVPPGDAEALAAALRRLLGDAKLRERLGQGARRRFDEGLRAPAMVDATLALYRRLAPG